MSKIKPSTITKLSDIETKLSALDNKLSSIDRSSTDGDNKEQEAISKKTDVEIETHIKPSPALSLDSSPEESHPIQNDASIVSPEENNNEAYKKLSTLDQQLDSLEQKVSLLTHLEPSATSKKRLAGGMSSTHLSSLSKTSPETSDHSSGKLEEREPHTQSSSPHSEESSSENNHEEESKSSIQVIHPHHSEDSSSEEASENDAEVTPKIKFLPPEHKSPPIDSPSEATKKANSEKTAENEAHSSEKEKDHTDSSHPAVSAQPSTTNPQQASENIPSKQSSEDSPKSEKKADQQPDFPVELDGPKTNPVHHEPSKEQSFFSFLDKMVPSQSDPDTIIALAVNCLWASLILSLIKLVYDFYNTPSSVFTGVQKVSTIVSIIIFITNFVLMFFIEKKRAWARTVFVFLTLVGIIPGILDIFSLFKTPFLSIVAMGQTFLRVYGIWLLYVPKVDHIFEIQKQNPESNNQNYD